MTQKQRKMQIDPVYPVVSSEWHVRFNIQRNMFFVKQTYSKGWLDFHLVGFSQKLKWLKTIHRQKQKTRNRNQSIQPTSPSWFFLVSSKNSTQHPNNFYPFQKKRRSVRSSQGRTVRSAASSNVARSQGSPLLRLRTVPKKKMRKWKKWQWETTDIAIVSQTVIRYR